MNIETKLIALDMDGTFVYPDWGIAGQAKKVMEEAVLRGIKTALIGSYSIRGLVAAGITPSKGYFHIQVRNGKIYFLNQGKYSPLRNGDGWFMTEERYPPQAGALMEEYKNKLCELAISYTAQGEFALDFESREEAVMAHDFIKKELAGISLPIRVVRSIWYAGNRDSWLPVYNIGLTVSKSKGVILKKIQDVLGISPHEVLAMGDSDNDRDMLDGRFGFRSATTSNADEDIKEAVIGNNGYVATRPFGEGVAEALERILNA